MSRLWVLVLPVLAAGVQEPPAPPRVEDDPGPPVLRRGGSAERRRTDPPPERVPSSGTPPFEEAHLIDRARSAAAEFARTLPDFVCDQITVRYEGNSRGSGWKQIRWKQKDRVEAEIVYTGGQEEYQNIRVNGKPLKKGTPIESGTWSIGEFATVLLDILSDTTDAAFTPRGEGEAAGVQALIYGFRVPAARAHWRVQFGSQATPPYQGALWIDPLSARVLRLEMDTRQLPPGYPVDTVESAIDYGWVEVGGSRHLLPVKSENLACFRGELRCTRNEIEFRNYRKFAVESQVMQVESEIKFPEDERSARGKKPR